MQVFYFSNFLIETAYDLFIKNTTQKETFYLLNNFDGIFVIISAKFLTLEHHCHKRLGVLLFELRSFLDSLDGLVARSRANQRAIVADSSQWGYWVDGLCDLFGTIFFMIAVLLICQKALPRKLITFNVRSLFYHWIPDKIKKNTLAMTEADQKVYTNKYSRVYFLITSFSLIAIFANS